MKPYTSVLFDRATAIAAQCFGKVNRRKLGKAAIVKFAASRKNNA